MAVEQRKETGRWGFRVYRHGKRYAKHAWATKLEAKDAEREFLVWLKNNPPPPRETLANIACWYLLDSATGGDEIDDDDEHTDERHGKSDHRLKTLRWNMNAFILPFFGESTLVGTITAQDGERFLK